MALRPTTAAFLSRDMTVTAGETNLTPTNGSDEYYTKNIILELLKVFMALLGLTGNAIVLWLLGFRMRRNAFSVYILNLAGADFLLLCCYIIDALETLLTNLSLISITITQHLKTVLVFAYISGLSFLSAISMERCMSVLWPIWYRCRRPRHMSTVMCALLWALSLLLSMLEGIYCGFLNWSGHDSWCQVLDFITVSWLILLFVLLSGSSLVLMARLLCGSHRVPPTRLYMTIVITVMVFLLCGLPFGIHWFLLFWFDAFPDLFQFVLSLSCVNSCANPIIFFFVGSFRQRWWKWRYTLRLVLQRALQDTPEVDEPGESLRRETLDMSGSSLGQG